MITVPESLPPFSPRGSVRCRMCGCTDVDAEFMENGRCAHNGTDNEIVSLPLGAPNPRQHRKCAECGHQWDERTLEDSPETRERLKAACLPIKAPAK